MLDDKIIAKAHNTKEEKCDITGHAEINCLRKAGKKLKTHQLKDAILYVTLEPCAMCATAISFARIRNIYFAATDEKGGGITSNAHIYDTDKHLWKPNVHQLPEFTEISATMLRDFFKQRRKKS